MSGDQVPTPPPMAGLPSQEIRLNAFAERWVGSVNEEFLSKLILFGEGSLHRALGEYVKHFHGQRNHQGKGNVILLPTIDQAVLDRPALYAAESDWEAC